MGEHKLREAGNSDGESTPPLSTHLVEVVDVSLANESDVERGIEAAYTSLQSRAKAEDSLIVSVVQTASTYVFNNVPCLTVVLTAQRIGRDDLERQQRLQRMQGGGR